VLIVTRGEAEFMITGGMFSTTVMTPVKIPALESVVVLRKQYKDLVEWPSRKNTPAITMNQIGFVKHWAKLF